jgi:hypothetical protein
MLAADIPGDRGRPTAAFEAYERTFASNDIRGMERHLVATSAPAPALVRYGESRLPPRRESLSNVCRRVSTDDQDGSAFVSMMGGNVSPIGMERPLK